MDKQKQNGERTGHNVPAETDTHGMNETEARQGAEQARARAGEESRPGGEAPGRPSEGRLSARARTMRRTRHAGRVRDEMGGAFGKTK